MRDARAVADVLRAGDRSVAAFDEYVAERAERMHRLKLTAQYLTAIGSDFSDAGRERRRALAEHAADDEQLFFLRAAAVAGPELAPPDSFTDETMQRALAYAG
jgi:2-polyprenyl-6-methoxyphenol hydroxylase-like FAD-dependent oxidoreductase